MAAEEEEGGPALWYRTQPPKVPCAVCFVLALAPCLPAGHVLVGILTAYGRNTRGVKVHSRERRELLGLGSPLI